MRIMIKGGVWKNTEDEILKAAVMKYGKNQWARISSLLVRKSAKQCKARWYEWLDPSIKKTEWTREEDEKLLHLAKLMPTQWRTIAPIVGRTPSQCLERYEKLLDAACAKDENYEANDDPRKLRPGEIDPNPESKPARPDPVDMDEDEKEMLSEARARLANTRGKKAKRKAREKQLEEARRLASLQKRRELKAAGIDNRHRRRKRKGIDYNAEIPFEKRPPPGFFDVSGEEKPVEQHKFPTTIEELEGKRRVDIEGQLRKQDAARNRIQQRQDAPAAILQANKLNDPEAVRKRSKLMLPAPQISDQELEEISKMGYANDLTLGSEELAEGSGATSSLVADYSQTPRRGMTSLRTPQRTPVGKVDAIMMEAENLARLRESQTPLLGGQNPELHPSDFTGVTPRKREMLTPNPLATPLASPGPLGLTPRIGITPSRDGVGGTPTFTPFRDDLHINEDVEVQDSAKLELRRQEELRRSLRSGLTYLPQPKNEYQIVMQPIPEENEENEDKIEEDMSDRIAREKAREQARLDALMKKRSKVLQRELPRPPSASLELIKSLLVKGDEDKSSFVPTTLFEQADEMINKELISLLEHDNAKYPLNEKTDKDKVKGAKHAENGRSSNPVPEIEDFDEDELREADSEINEEMEFLRVAMGHENESFDDFNKARDACLEDLMFFPSRNNYGLASVAGSLDKLAALQNEFEIMKKKMDEEAKKAARLEQKIKVLTHGYQMRAGKLWTQIEGTVKQMGTSATELECFQALHKQERSAASYRIDNMIEEVGNQKLLERTLQARYGNLITEEERMQRILQAHKERLQAEAEMAARKRAAEEMAAKQREAEEIAAKKREAEEIAAIKLAAEEIAAKMRADEEEIAAKKRADEEEIAAKKRADEEEIAAKKCADEEEIAAKKHADEEKIAAKKQADEVEIATKKCTDEEEIAAKMLAHEEEIAAKKCEDEPMASEKCEDEPMASEKCEDEPMASEKCEEVDARKHTAEAEIAARDCLSKADDAARNQAVEVAALRRDDASDAMNLTLEEEQPAVDEIPGGSKTQVETLVLTENSVENDRILDPMASELDNDSNLDLMESEQVGENQPTLDAKSGDDNTLQTSVTTVDTQTDSQNPSFDPPQRESQIGTQGAQVEARQEFLSAGGNVDASTPYDAAVEGEREELEADDKNVEDMQEQ